MKKIIEVLKAAKISYDDRLVRFGMIFVSDPDDEIIINRILRKSGIENYSARPVNALHPFLDPRLIIEKED